MQTLYEAGVFKDGKKFYYMILGSKGHTFHARMKKYDFGTRKQTKVARIGRISFVFRIAGAQSA